MVVLMSILAMAVPTAGRAVSVAHRAPVCNRDVEDTRRKRRISALVAVDRSDCPKKLERAYSKHYRQVANRVGKRAPGRNIRKRGVLFRGIVFDAVCSEIRRSDRPTEKAIDQPALLV